MTESINLLEKFKLAQSLKRILPGVLSISTTKILSGGLNLKTGGTVNDSLLLEVDSNNLVNLMLFLRDHTSTQLKMCMDIVGVDEASRNEKDLASKRFSVIYNLLSIQYNQRLFVKVRTNEVDGVPSISSIFKSALCYEREVYDFFGIVFLGHPDLRRILTDYGFQGHPLRKDFPLTGYYEVRYDDTQKRLVNEPVEFAAAHKPW